MDDRVLARLRAAVGDEHVIVDRDVRAGYETDWTGRYSGPSAAVVRPGATAEVAAVLTACLDHRTVVIPQGGNTGLVGGSVPRQDRNGTRPIVLSLRRLTELGPVDAGAQQVTAGAGVTLTDWRRHAERSGLDVPVDFAARDSATVGGAIATNAGGSRVLRFGTMRRQVVGIEAVLASGMVVGSLAGLPKETAGIHWPSLLVGSEGTLAVVTRARLRLVPRFEYTITAMVRTETVDDAVGLLARLRAGVAALDAVEIVMPAALDLVARHLNVTPPVRSSGCVLLIECADHSDPSEALNAALVSAPEVQESVATNEPWARQRLLAFRDRITEAVAAAARARGGTPFKLDVAVPLGALGRLLELAEAAAAEDGADLVPFGHLAEGNLHLNHIGARDTARIAETVLTGVAELGGTISGEHGIGIAKVPWLHLIRSPAELDAQREVARALDPAAILNPGVLHP